MLSILDHNVTLARAGAVAQYVQNVAIFCGGRSLKGVHKDCKMYDPRQDVWANFSSMSKFREEGMISQIKIVITRCTCSFMRPRSHALVAIFELRIPIRTIYLHICIQSNF